MAGTRTTNTFDEELVKTYQTITNLKTLADADLPWVIQLETMVLDKIRSPERKLQQMGLIPGQGQNPQGNAAMGLPGAPPMDMGMSAPPPSFAGAGAPPGVMMSPPPPNPAELAGLGL